MTRDTYTPHGTRLIQTEEVDPQCGNDFCDSCGDCLHCYGGDECPHSNDGEHFWVVYQETVASEVET